MHTLNEPSGQPEQSGATGIEIAIVGMAGRFPGAADVDALWRNIRDGVESVAAFTDEQLRAQGIAQELLDDPAYVKAGTQFKGVDQFDAGFFGYSPREAEYLDPQQRIFLECAWAALEHAGCDAQAWPGKVGVYAGEGPNLYLMRHLLPAFGLGDGRGIAELLGLMSGNSGGSLCTRVAYKLDLRGPAVTVQTACSTSLAAVHTACQALLGYDCDMALAGGVWLNLLQDGGYLYQEGEILSPDGHCRAFDENAAARCHRQRRRPRGAQAGWTTRCATATPSTPSSSGSAANNDGSREGRLHRAQRERPGRGAARAQLIAGVDAANRWATSRRTARARRLGDPIEVAALTQAFQAGSGAGLLRHRLREDQHRPPRRGGRCHRPHQDRDGAEAPDAAGQPALRAAESADRLRGQPVLRQRRDQALARGRHAAPRRRELVRHRRHQRACGARRGAG
jgi:phthiocerol/phenolphthiocerol synthesis type-I polyketide synthase E